MSLLRPFIVPFLAFGPIGFCYYASTLHGVWLEADYQTLLIAFSFWDFAGLPDFKNAAEGLSGWHYALNAPQIIQGVHGTGIESNLVKFEDERLRKAYVFLADSNFAPFVTAMVASMFLKASR